MYQIDLANMIEKNSLPKRKTINNLGVGEKVLVLAKRIKQKSAPGKFQKKTVQNMPYFNKETMLITRKNQNKTFYWLKNE